MRSVADFLSANRLAGRYLLTIGGEMGAIGVISLVGAWQVFMSAGFPSLWWGLLSAPVSVILVMTGWVYYRLRETRALTVAQFFEMRYSRRFRIFAGLVCWLSGIINFGIFPAVAARFLIYFCGLPLEFAFPGTSFMIPTYPAIMVAELGIALFFVNTGGQVSVMVTEVAQGMIACFAYIAIVIAVLVLVPWHSELTALKMAPANASMLNPFQTGSVHDFNVWYYLISIFALFYGYQTWLGTQGFMTSARNPHEQRMGNIILVWRRMPYSLLTWVVPLAAYTILHLPQYADLAATVNASVHGISNTAVQNEMTVPIVLAHLLPVGLKGIVVMVVIFLSFTCHDTYMHSWGSMFVQDVLMPLRNKPLRPTEHVRWLRWSIFFVAVFGFFFSLLYQETDKIYFFMAITGTIWLGGAGAVMIGGLYSRIGTTAGAYAAMIAGAVLGIAGLIIPQIWTAHHTTPFPINGQWMLLIGSLISIALYVLISVATGGAKRPFNLERMLHRGAYAVDPHEHEVKSTVKNRWQEMLGMGSEFSTGDKILAILYAVWTLAQVAVFVVVTIMHYGFNAVPDSFWTIFWPSFIWIQVAISIPATIWFTVGGIKDIRDLFADLKTASRNHDDDGRVVDQGQFKLAAAPVDNVDIDAVEEVVR